jgi:hypothetical protein
MILAKALPVPMKSPDPNEGQVLHVLGAGGVSE